MFEDDKLVLYFSNQMLLGLLSVLIFLVFERIYQRYNIKANRLYQVNLKNEVPFLNLPKLESPCQDRNLINKSNRFDSSS